MSETSDLIERLNRDAKMLRDGWHRNLTKFWHSDVEAANDCAEAAAELAERERRIGELTRERDEARAEQARLQKERDYSVRWANRSVDSIKEKCFARAEKAEAMLARVPDVLGPFAAVAEHDIGESETDGDRFRPMTSHNRAPLLMVGHLRAARALYEEARALAKSEDR